jgi:tetratricopeptide (TPR) repeat protein
MHPRTRYLRAWLASAAALGALATFAQNPVATGSSAGANPFAAHTEKAPSIYDYQRIDNVTERVGAFIELNEDLPGSVEPAQLSVDAAQRAIRSWLAEDRNRPFLAAVRDQPKLQNVESLNAAALVFFAKGRNSEAFACLLLAWEKAPKNPHTLLNLASASLVFGRANEALPLIAEAEKSGELPPGACGLSGPLLADYLRGYAFMLRGEYSEAKPRLQRVVASQPDLKEAALTLALVEEKLGEDPRKAFLQGVWRRRPKLVANDVPTPTTIEEARRDRDGYTEGEDVSPSMDDLFDVSRGQPGQLTLVKQPKTPDELLAVLSPYGEGMVDCMSQAARFHNEVAGPAYQSFEKSAASPDYKRRMLSLYSRATIRYGSVKEIDRAARETDFLAADYDRRIEKAVETAMAEQQPIRARHAERNNRPGHPTKAELREQAAELNGTTQTAMSTVEPVLRQYLHALDREYTLRSSYMHGMLAHIGAPALRSALQAEAEAVRYETQQLQFAAILKLAHALGATEHFPPDKPQPGAGGKGPPCSDEDAKWSLSVDLVVVGAELSCNSVSLELEAPVIPPFVGVSAELGIDTSGTVTAFAGPKVSVSGVGSAKEGFYITGGKDGVRDFGGKAELKASTGFGPVSGSYKVGEGTISFVPSPDPGPPPGSLPTFRN